MKLPWTWFVQTCPLPRLNEELEAFSMVFEKAAYGANLLMGWDKTQVSLPIRWTNQTAAATSKETG